MQKPSTQAILHALKVGGHIFVSILVVGIVSYFDKHSEMMQAFTSWLVSFGIPAGIVNMVVAGIMKYLKASAEAIPSDVQP